MPLRQVGSRVLLLALLVVQGGVIWWPSWIDGLFGAAEATETAWRVVVGCVSMIGAAILGRWGFSAAEEVDSKAVESEPEADRFQLWYLAIALVLVGLIAAVARGELDVVRAMLVAVFGAGMVVVAWLFWDDTDPHDFRVERHWGTLGGPSGGWTLSLGMIRLILFLAFLSALVFTVVTFERSVPEASEVTEKTSATDPGTTPAPADPKASAGGAGSTAADPQPATGGSLVAPPGAPSGAGAGAGAAPPSSVDPAAADSNAAGQAPAQGS